VDDFEPETVDPLDEPDQGGLIRQLGAEGGMSVLVMTSQSSKAARSMVPAWPAKVISYVCDRIR
jgi:hypothetical protein